MPTQGPGRLLETLVGVTAIAAPLLHSISDVLEWHHQGFTSGQLWLGYAGFLPMPWLLLGIYALHPARVGVVGFVGALLYGLAFQYFSHTTLYALAEGVPNHRELVARLGLPYAIYGTCMIYGALLFAWACWRSAWLPKASLLLFALGIVVNVSLWAIDTPASYQTIGSAIRNTGLVVMGCAILFRRTGTLA